MNVRKSDVFIADVEKQFEWYLANAGEEVAERYLNAVEATCHLLGRYPQLGPAIRFSHPRLQGWRFFVVFRPFKKHVIFYEIAGKEVTVRRIAHGSRDLPRRLIENP